ncbi:12688_t:CDS:2 [Entrophospora sp. SA101]|nr:1983_t:CDS:2 [Entrophospora sp. SA101]CAJ0887556.1 12688_t:CDS:2 [Entrophospora sp. SA101]
MKYRYLFKEEKQLESALEVDKNETDNIYEELMSIGFDSLDASIGSVELHERLNINDDFLKKSAKVIRITGPHSNSNLKAKKSPIDISKDVDVDDIDDFLRSLDNEPQTAKPSIKNIGKKKINTIVNNKDDDENWLDDILK